MFPSCMFDFFASYYAFSCSFSFQMYDHFCCNSFLTQNFSSLIFYQTSFILHMKYFTDFPIFNFCFLSPPFTAYIMCCIIHRENHFYYERFIWLLRWWWYDDEEDHHHHHRHCLQCNHFFNSFLPNWKMVVLYQNAQRY